jgi:sugar lactone lactonase YvrE
VFDKDGKFVESWPIPSRGHMVITADDTVYASDVNTGAVSIVRDGKIVEAITGMGRPHGMTLDTDGAVYASDSANRVVMKATLKK